MPEFNMCEVLSEATKLSPKVRESAFLYSRRLIKELAGEDFPADDWDALPDEAQQWVNEQIRATNENKQVEDVPGFDEYLGRVSPRFTTVSNGSDEVEAKPVRQPRLRAVQAVEEVEDEPVEDAVEEPVEYEEEEEAPVKVKKARGRPKGSTAKEAKPKVEKEPKGPRAYMTRKRADGKPSAIVRVKEYLLAEPQLTPNQIMEKLSAENYPYPRRRLLAARLISVPHWLSFQDKGLLTRQLI